MNIKIKALSHYHNKYRYGYMKNGRLLGLKILVVNIYCTKDEYKN